MPLDLARVRADDGLRYTCVEGGEVGVRQICLDVLDVDGQEFEGAGADQLGERQQRQGFVAPGREHTLLLGRIRIENGFEPLVLARCVLIAEQGYVDSPRDATAVQAQGLRYESVGGEPLLAEARKPASPSTLSK